MLRCLACGGRSFTDKPVIWDELAELWELSPEERAFVDRQQGTHCTSCGSNLRSIALAQAILGVFPLADTLRELAAHPRMAAVRILEINEAGTLGPFLSMFPGRTLACYPELDMQSMHLPDASSDLVLHSDTLEHVPNPLQALSECVRVLKPGGAMCFTVPTLVGRLTRSCAGRPASYHGSPGERHESMRVQTEFGADVWTWCMRAGFDTVAITAVDYPSALAFTATRADAANPAARAEAERLHAELAAMRASTSWRRTAPLRWAGSLIRRLVD